jgi:hypothetical protein
MPVMLDIFDDRVREAVLCDTCPKDFAAEVLTRINGGKLSLFAIAHLLLETPAGGGWNSIREAIVNDLASQPSDALQVFDVAVSALRWPPLVMGKLRREGPPNLPTFTGSVRITPPGAESPIEASADGPSVKLAQHRAALVLLAILARPRARTARSLPKDSD